MSILLPNGRHWTVSNWITRGFFDDAIPFLRRASRIGADIQFCIDADLDTLNLESADTARLQELQELVTAIIEANRERQGSNFVDSGAFPIYMEKLADLSRTVEFLLSTGR